MVSACQTFSTVILPTSGGREPGDCEEHTGRGAPLEISEVFVLQVFTSSERWLPAAHVKGSAFPVLILSWILCAKICLISDLFSNFYYPLQQCSEQAQQGVSK